MPTDNENGYKFKAGEFQGMVKTKLDGICKEMAEIKTEIKSIRKRVDGNRLKIAGIGATVSLIVTILTLLIKELMAG